MDRCPYCHWEMEDGECLRCGFPASIDDSDDYGADGSLLGGIYGYPESTIETDSEDESEINSRMEDTDLGSMDGFVVHDIQSGVSPRISSRRSWSSDDGDSSSDDRPEFPTEMFSPRSIQSTSDVTEQPSEAMSSDSGVLPGARASRATSTSGTSSDESSSEEDSSMADASSSSGEETPTPPPTPPAGHRDHHASRVPPRAPEVEDDSEPHPAANMRGTRRARQALIQPSRRARASVPEVISIPSDSDESVTVAMPRRQRRTRARLLSDDGTETPAPVADRHADTEDRQLRSGRVTQITQTRHNRPSNPPQTLTTTSQRAPNMPGAFPPSFSYSEQGDSQIPPTIMTSNRDEQEQISNAPPANRPAANAISRRPLAPPRRSIIGSSQAIDREAEKTARRTDRRRLKANLNARQAAQGSLSASTITN